MPGLTDAIGEGAKEFIRLDPVFGLIILVSWAVIGVLWVYASSLRKEIKDLNAARLKDKDDQLIEAKKDREFWEKMLERSENTGRRRAT